MLSAGVTMSMASNHMEWSAILHHARTFQCTRVLQKPWTKLAWAYYDIDVRARYIENSQLLKG